MKTIYDTFSAQEKHNIITQLFDGQTSEFQAMCQKIDQSNIWFDALLVLHDYTKKRQWEYFDDNQQAPIFSLRRRMMNYFEAEERKACRK